MRNAIGFVVGWFGFNFARGGRELIGYKKNGCMSDMVVSGKTFSSPYVMSDDVDDIQDPRYDKRRRTFFNLLINVLYTCGFAWAWMALRARNASPSGCNPQNTCHGPRPGPKLAYWVRASSLCATEPRARGETRGRKEKMPIGEKNTFIYI